MDIINFSNEPPLSSSSSLHVFYISPNHHQPHTPILNHQCPLHHQFAFSLLSLPTISSSPSHYQRTIQTASDNDCEDQIRVKVEIFVSKVLGKGELCPCTLLEITKMSFVASMWHVPFVRSMKIDDMNQFC